MAEARLLSLVLRYPHPTALARRVGNGGVVAILRRLEGRGLVTRRRGLYRLTRRGRAELELTQALSRLLVRTHALG
jgi:DNA-binding PadR family transcriptional regulator